jgi:hypothetical protein
MPHCVDTTTLPGGDDRNGNPPSKYNPTRRAYGPTHYGMGRMPTTLTFKTNQANEGLDPATQDRGHRLHDQQGDRRPRGGYLLPHCRHDATGRTGDDDGGHSKLTSHRTVGEPPPCQHCRHDWHCSIMSCHAATWAQDHNDNHIRTYADARQNGLSCKPILLISPPSGSRPLGRDNLSLCM